MKQHVPTTEIVPDAPESALAPRPLVEPDLGPLTAQEIKAQVQLIQEVMSAVMQEGFHYGTLPGTEKPTLLKSGAEKLTTTFRLAPLLNVETREIGTVHREYEVRCTLVHIPTGRVHGEGVGSCSTLESKYRWRNQERTCPHCNRPTIIKGRAEYGGGWICFQKKGGCGAKFTDQDPVITSQPMGRVENPDIADVYNTVLKMAKKRALIDATLTCTAASDIFTQDLEDFAEAGTREERRREERQPQLGLALRPAEGRGLTKAQHDILTLALRRAQVTDEEFAAYLAETYRIADRGQVLQKDFNQVLEWVEEQENARVAEEERQAAALDDRPLPAPAPAVRRETKAFMQAIGAQGLKDPDVLAHLKRRWSLSFTGTLINLLQSLSEDQYRMALEEAQNGGMRRAIEESRK